MSFPAAVAAAAEQLRAAIRACAERKTAHRRDILVYGSSLIDLGHHLGLVRHEVYALDRLLSRFRREALCRVYTRHSLDLIEAMTWGDLADLPRRQDAALTYVDLAQRLAVNS